ncbi:adenosylcobinamide-GDP ribazoletransferase [bacterium]|nr:adenosylcobinamide-GDP ribazoletransferase [bacterium]
MFNKSRIRDKVGTTLLAPQNDLFKDTLVALSLLTRLPIKLDDDAYAHSARAAWAYPLVGVVTGLLACIAAQVALWIGLPLWCAATFALATGIVVTGAMHEDGLGDCADGFWGGWDPAMRLKIMKDSQIGTYGVLALLVTMGLRFGVIWEMLRWDTWVLPLIAIHVASRAVMPAVMTMLPHARDTGLSKSVGRVNAISAQIAASIGAVALGMGFGLFGLALVLVAIITTLVCVRLARAKIGGQTGDVCGASQQICEVALLLAVLAG